MITIEILNNLIQMDLKFEKEFSNAYKYIKEGNPDYYIESEFIDEVKPYGELVSNTTYFDTYKIDGGTLQIQRTLEGNVIGSIKYLGNRIILSMIDKSFVTEYLLSQYAMVYIISKENALLMHGSSFVYNDIAIILTAPSGTGKSTHSRLWQKYENVTVLNDDKNILNIEDNKIVLYPSPWSGKHHLDNNIKAELKAIVFLYQNKENVIERLKPMAAFRLLVKQLEVPSIENKDRWSNMVDKLLELPIYHLGCNMEKEAYLTLKNKLEEDLYAN